MKYVYPVILFNDEGKIGVRVPDLPGCFTFGVDKADALIMVKDAIETWLWDAENKGETIPPASDKLSVADGEIQTLVVADTEEYRKMYESKAIKKTLSLPSWLNARAESAGVNFSQTLQRALKQELGIAEP